MSGQNSKSTQFEMDLSDDQRSLSPFDMLLDSKNNPSNNDKKKSEPLPVPTLSTTYNEEQLKALLAGSVSPEIPAASCDNGANNIGLSPSMICHNADFEHFNADNMEINYSSIVCVEPNSSAIFSEAKGASNSADLMNKGVYIKKGTIEDAEKILRPKKVIVEKPSDEPDVSCELEPLEKFSPDYAAFCKVSLTNVNQKKDVQYNLGNINSYKMAASAHIFNKDNARRVVLKEYTNASALPTIDAPVDRTNISPSRKRESDFCGQRSTSNTMKITAKFSERQIDISQVRPIWPIPQVQQAAENAAAQAHDVSPSKRERLTETVSESVLLESFNNHVESILRRLTGPTQIRVMNFICQQLENADKENVDK